MRQNGILGLMIAAAAVVMAALALTGAVSVPAINAGALAGTFAWLAGLLAALVTRDGGNVNAAALAGCVRARGVTGYKKHEGGWLRHMPETGNLRQALVQMVEYENHAGRGWRIYTPEPDNPHLGQIENADGEYGETVGYMDEQLEVKIPDTLNGKPVVAIEQYAFHRHTGLTVVIIPGSVTNIGAGAFHGCTGLKGLTIPDSVTDIEMSAFQRCESLASITIPSRVTTIESATFSGCASLASVIIGSGVSNIGDYAFYGCGKLESITIPSGVTEIGQEAFNGCDSLTNVTFEKGSNIARCLFHAVHPFPGDLREKYLAGGAGTYTRESGGSNWAK